jgi:DNA-binding HxlR family transcriptional regulator
MKTYSQYCPVAHALDLVGERWSLLIVRELILGARRYTDLAEALPGIGSNILAGRLRDLERAGIVRRTKLPPPAAATVYELTPEGHELDRVLQALAEFGARSLPAPQAGACWSAYAVQMRFRADAAVDGAYELRFGADESLAIVVRDGRPTVFHAPAPAPDLLVQVDDPEALLALLDGRLPAAEALQRGVSLLAGSIEELGRFAAMFAPRAPAAATAAATS